ncbi:MAG: tetratricopeptide repeat protein [Pyrinomonadaceae bacterium]
MCQRQRTLAPALACLLLLLAAASVGAQGANTLDGRAVLPNGGQPPNSVRVTLTIGGRRIQETFTDAGGRFYFTGLAPGRYRLTAEGDGATFETTSVYIDISALQPSTQNLTLLARRVTTAAAPAVVSVEELDSNVPAPAREKYQKALKRADDDKPEQVAKLLAEAVREHPGFYAAHLALGEQYAKLQRYDEALTSYRRASQLKPDRSEAYVGIGVTLVNQKRYDEGILLLRRIVELDANLAAPYLSLGYAEMMTGNYPAAEKYLLRADELGKPAIVHIYLANVYEQIDKPAKAIEHLQTYLKTNPQSQNAESVRVAIEKLRKKSKEKQ